MVWTKGAPEALDGGAKAALTLDEWKAFWATHGQQNDGGSVMHPGMKVSYDAKSRELRIELPFDPATVRSTPHKKIRTDFLGKPVPEDGTARPGPFQSLAADANVFKAWDGLPLLAEGELPK